MCLCVCVCVSACDSLTHSCSLTSRGRLLPSLIRATHSHAHAHTRQVAVADDCVQLHGGWGYMWEYPVCRALADGRVQKIYGAHAHTHTHTHTHTRTRTRTSTYELTHSSCSSLTHTLTHQVAVADDCVQLHGGWGYMWEYPVCRALADGRVQKIYGGTNEIMKELISREVAK